LLQMAPDVFGRVQFWRRIHPKDVWSTQPYRNIPCTAGNISDSFKSVTGSVSLHPAGFGAQLLRIS
jgi:hypothetical protein